MAEQTGLLDFLNSPGGMGLLSAVGAGLAGARRGGTLNAIGSGLLGGVQGYAQGQGLQQQQQFNQQRQKLFDSQVAENDLQNKARQQALERQQRIDGALRDAFTPVAPIDANRVSGVVGPRPQALDVVGQRKPVDYQSLIAMGAPMDLVKGLAEAPNLGRAKVARTVEGQDAQGNKMTYQLDEFGQRVGDGVAGYTAPVQVDLGGRVQFVKPAAGVNLNKTMSPGERDASARGWANVGLQREQANRDAQSVTYQQDQDGNFVALPTKVQPGSMVRGLPVVSGPGMVPLKGSPKDAKLTEGEGKATLYLGQMRSASDTLGRLSADGKGADPWQVAMTGSVGGNLFASSNAQQIGQAQNQWSEAYLRQKTGAAATKQEIDLNNRTFFPQIGDSPAVIKQKSEMRLQAEQGMEIPAGRGAARINQPGAPAVGTVKDGYRFKGGNPADSNSWEKV